MIKVHSSLQGRAALEGKHQEVLCADKSETTFKVADTIEEVDEFYEQIESRHSNA